MSEQPFSQEHGGSSGAEPLETRVQEMARGFECPTTPDVAGSVRRRIEPNPARDAARRRLLWAAIILLVSMCGLLAVPQVRAAILDILRLGNVVIFQTPPTATSTPTPNPSAVGPSATPHPTATLLPSLLDLAGET